MFNCIISGPYQHNTHAEDRYIKRDGLCLESFLAEISSHLGDRIVRRSGLDTRISSVHTNYNCLLALYAENTTSALLATNNGVITTKSDVFNTSYVETASSDTRGILEGSGDVLSFSWSDNETLSIR